MRKNGKKVVLTSIFIVMFLLSACHFSSEDQDSSGRNSLNNSRIHKEQVIILSETIWKESDDGS